MLVWVLAQPELSPMLSQDMELKKCLPILFTRTTSSKCLHVLHYSEEVEEEVFLELLWMALDSIPP